MPPPTTTKPAAKAPVTTPPRTRVAAAPATASGAARAQPASRGRVEESSDDERDDDDEEEDASAADEEDGAAEEGEEEEAEEEDSDEDEEHEEAADDEESDGGSEDLGDDPIHATVQLAGSEACNILHFRNEVTHKEFRAAIAAACGLPEKSKFVVARKRKTKAPQLIETRSQFDAMIDWYFDQQEQFLRLLVTPAASGAADATPRAAATSKAATATTPLPLAMASLSNVGGAGQPQASNLYSPPPLAVFGSSPVAGDAGAAASAARMTSPAGSTDFAATGSMMMAGSKRPSSSCSRFESTETDALKAAFESGQEVQWTEMRLLGTGAFGKVVEAITSAGHIVAVKHMLYPASNASTNATEADTMVEEIRLMKNLRHRHIVAYYGCQSKAMSDGARVVDVFMEACHGGSINSLRKKLDKTNARMNVTLVRSYTRQVLDGLSYLHMKQVVHRDIKGDNVLISSNGIAKLADFGCSKKLGTASFEDTLDLESQQDSRGPNTMPALAGANGAMCKTLVGTPLFIAPEVLTESGGGYLHSADIWSVGCLVIEMFGKKPWNLQNTSVFSVMFAIAQSKSLPTGMPTETDPHLLSFLTSCFQRDPALRPTARALLEHPWMTCPDSELVEPVWASDVKTAPAAAAAAAAAAAPTPSLAK